jgi:hypothetical protein
VKLMALGIGADDGSARSETKGFSKSDHSTSLAPYGTYSVTLLFDCLVVVTTSFVRGVTLFAPLLAGCCVSRSWLSEGRCRWCRRRSRRDYSARRRHFRSLLS